MSQCLTDDAAMLIFQMQSEQAFQAISSEDVILNFLPGCTPQAESAVVTLYLKTKDDYGYWNCEVVQRPKGLWIY